MITLLATARIPASQTALAASAPCQYMSTNFVVPARIISAQPSRVPQ